jgi:tetrapyrrole methylase family protein/MazG family protein
MTSTAAITILGLGPGHIDDLTLQAQTVLAQAAEMGQSVYFRTTVHPTVPPLRQRLPQLQIISFDWLYEESTDWNSLYQRIADELCAIAAQQPIIYAVPGHPLIGESSVQLLLKQARERHLQTRIVAGLSFLEPVCTLLGLDPLAQGTQIVDATDLAALDSSEVAGKIIPTIPLLVGQVYNRRVASAVKLALGECYPDEWPVKLVRAASVHGLDLPRPTPPLAVEPNEREDEQRQQALAEQFETAQEEAVIEMPLYELDRNHFANHLSTLYVPPVDALTALRVPETLRYITMRLRREPDGCPWDRAQTHQTLTRYVLEESYEVVEAIEEGDMDHLAEELGDLLLQVYLHAEVARQAGEFTLGDVFEHVNAKLIRRHPHVFGDAEVNSAAQVVRNWEAIKQQEKLQAGKPLKQESLLDGVPLASPALTVTREYHKVATKVGFYYKKIEDLYKKVQEELQEVHDATSEEHRFEEIGDLLLVTVELAHHYGIDAEAALRQANRKFRRRFMHMEQQAQAMGRSIDSFTDEEWDELWNKAKEATNMS